MRPLSKTEKALGWAVVLMLALAAVWPAMRQPAGHHAFADQRTLGGLPYAMDVLTNLPFALAGLAGALLLWRLPAGALSNMQRAMASLFFVGLVITACGSSWYHLAPDDAGLAVDRYAMSIAFAGLLGLAAAGRISERAGAALGMGVLLLAPLAVAHWAATANIVPWAVVQFGGMGLVLGFALLREPHGCLPVCWWGVIATYALAKVFETNDHALFELTGNWISGHSAKHVVASAAALPVLSALRAARERGQNAAAIALA